MMNSVLVTVCVMLTVFKNVHCNDTTFRIIPRAEWFARSPRSISPLLENPAPFAVIHHSATQTCTTEAQCKKLVKSIQNYHMDSNKWNDIGYNFLIGGEGGFVLEGRGWDVFGAHSPAFNRRSIGICFLGNYMDRLPTENELQAAKDLIQFGVDNGKLKSNYHLVGHKQGSNTECPGVSLYANIKTWLQFDPSPVI